MTLLLLLLLLFPLLLSPVIIVLFSKPLPPFSSIICTVYFSSHFQPLGATTVFTADLKGGVNTCRAFIRDQAFAEILSSRRLLLCFMFPLKINPLLEGRATSSLIDETGDFLLFVILFSTCSVFVKDLVQL